MSRDASKLIFIGDVFKIGEKALSLSSKSMDVAIHNSKVQDQTISKESDNQERRIS